MFCKSYLSFFADGRQKKEENIDMTAADILWYTERVKSKQKAGNRIERRNGKEAWKIQQAFGEPL